MPSIGTSGPEDFSIRVGTKIKVNGDEVLVPTEPVIVDPGADTTLGAYYIIDNAECGFGLEAWWSTAISIRDMTHNRPVGAYRDDNANGEVGDGNPSVNIGKVTEPTEFRIRIWANQDWKAPLMPSANY
jgi:hypothetical protein